MGMKPFVCAVMAAGAIALAASGTIASAGSGGKKFTGFASYYKSGKVTANGEKFRPMGLTAAHRTLPFGTKVRVKNLRTGRSVVVRINDRGPFIDRRVIDLSLGAAKKIGMIKHGIVKVHVTVL